MLSPPRARVEKRHGRHAARPGLQKCVGETFDSRRVDEQAALVEMPFRFRQRDETGHFDIGQGFSLAANAIEEALLVAGAASHKPESVFRTASRQIDE